MPVKSIVEQARTLAARHELRKKEAAALQPAPAAVLPPGEDEPSFCNPGLQPVHVLNAQRQLVMVSPWNQRHRGKGRYFVTGNCFSKALKPFGPLAPVPGGNAPTAKPIELKGADPNLVKTIQSAIPGAVASDVGQALGFVLARAEGKTARCPTALEPIQKTLENIARAVANKKAVQAAPKLPGAGADVPPPPPPQADRNETTAPLGANVDLPQAQS